MNVFHPDTAFILSLVLSVFIPLVSSLLGRAHWPGEVLGILTALISGANGFFTEWAESSRLHHYDWRTALGLALGSFVVASLGRVILWAGTRTDAKILAFPSASPPRQNIAA